MKAQMPPSRTTVIPTSLDTPVNERSVAAVLDGSVPPPPLLDTSAAASLMVMSETAGRRCGEGVFPSISFSSLPNWVVNAAKECLSDSHTPNLPSYHGP